MSDTGHEKKGPLAGRWKKVTTDPCADKYPQGITFAASTYRGSRGQGQGMVWWDAGIYRVEGPDTLVLSVASSSSASVQVAGAHAPLA